MLIGPAGAGKSTVGAGVAAAVGREFVDLDAIAGPYYAEAGWSVARVRRRIEDVGRVAAEREWEPARAHAVERAVGASPGVVLALGAGHSSYTNASCRERVHAALRTCQHVWFLEPYEEPARSVRELRARCLRERGVGWRSEDGHDFLAEWVTDPFARSLATETVRTGGESPEETVARLAALVNADMK